MFFIPQEKTRLLIKYSSYFESVTRFTQIRWPEYIAYRPEKVLSSSRYMLEGYFRKRDTFRRPHTYLIHGG